MIYTIADFNNIRETGFDYECPEETIEIINDLASQVGAPDYVKTPIFPNKKNEDSVNRGEFLEAGSSRRNGRRRRRNQEYNDAEWNAMQTLSVSDRTQRNKNEQSKHEIFMKLNSVTNLNLLELCSEIWKYAGALSDNSDELKEFCNEIIQRISVQSRNIDVYVEIMSKLHNGQDDISESISETFNTMLSQAVYDDGMLLANFETVDPDEEYDTFCELNELYDKVENRVRFYAHCAANEIISVNTFYTSIASVYDLLFSYYTISDTKYSFTKEHAEYLFKVLEKIVTVYNDDQLQSVITGILEGANNKTLCQTLGSKCHFKLMDIDAIHNEKN